MPVVDLIIVGLTVAAGAWGYWRGVMTKALALAGFGVGAFFGFCAAAPVLARVLPTPYGLALAVPAAIVCGLLVAAALERIGLGSRRGWHLPARDRLDGAGGALLAAPVAVLLIWIVAAVAGRVDALSTVVGDSAVVDGLSAVVPPLGPLVSAEGSDREVFGAEARSRPPRVNVRRDPQVRAAKASVVKIRVATCGSGRGGSGWIAADGIVVTNAHVVARSNAISLQLEGERQQHAAQAIWYDEMGDVAILRAPGLSGEPALAIEDRAEPGSQLAMLGFPGGGPYTVEPARLGVSSTVQGVAEEGPYRTRRGKTLIAHARPGNSGGPVVDLKGHVVGVVFARASPQNAALAVPPATVKRALRHAGGPVDTGACEGD